MIIRQDKNLKRTTALKNIDSLKKIAPFCQLQQTLSLAFWPAKQPSKTSPLPLDVFGGRCCIGTGGISTNL